MKLFKVAGKRLVHKAIPLPSIANQHVCATERMGPACGPDFGFFYVIETFDGEKEDITCQKCRSLA